MKNKTVAPYNVAVVKTVDSIAWVFTILLCVGMLVFAANVMANANQQEVSKVETLPIPLMGINLGETITDGNEG